MENSVKVVENSEIVPKPAERTEPRAIPPYRIICNSEHFIVINPVPRTKKKTVRADEP